MKTDNMLREHLRRLLNWEDAHVNFDTAVAGIPVDVRGSRPEGHPHSLWEIVEHLRRTQRDILDFCLDPAYVEPAMSEYWPDAAAPKSEAAWNESLGAFREDRDELVKLALDTSRNLFDRIPHGNGQTYLRELVLVADHTAYHVGQLVLVRRALGAWPT
jgi:hypothetical protein